MAKSYNRRAVARQTATWQHVREAIVASGNSHRLAVVAYYGPTEPAFLVNLATMTIIADVARVAFEKVETFGT